MSIKDIEHYKTYKIIFTLCSIVISIFIILFGIYKEILYPQEYIIMIDYKVYQENKQPYFTSFQHLYSIIEPIDIYIPFIIICTILSAIIILILLKEYMVVFAYIVPQMLGRIVCGNIDPFIFLIIVICLYFKENNYFVPILISFICFKPTIFLIVPYFLYVTKNKYIFLSIFCLSFVIFNFDFFLLGIQGILDFINASYSVHSDYHLYFRYWMTYVYYYGFKEYLKNYNKGLFIRT